MSFWRVATTEMIHWPWIFVIKGLNINAGNFSFNESKETTIYSYQVTKYLKMCPVLFSNK